MRAHRFVAVLAAGLLASPASALTINSTWNGTVGNWSDATRWSSNPLFPNNGGGDTFNATVPGGTVTVDVPITIDALTFSSGATITGSQNLSTQGVFGWGNGTLSGTGTLTANGGLVMDNNTHVLTSKTLVNAGAATLTNASGGTLRLDGASALFDNQLGSTFAAGANTSGHAISFIGTAGSFQNSGTFNKVGSNTLTVNSRFDNLGQFDVDGGTVNFSSGAFTNTGDLAVDAGTLVQFGGGTGHSFLAGSTVGGLGTLRVAGGTLSTATDLDAAVVELISGTLTNAAAVDVNGQLIWNNAALGGAGALTANGGLVMDNNTHVLTSKTLVNAGAATLTNASGGTLRLDGASALFDNQLGSTFAAGANTSGHAISFIGTAGSFQNSGTFNKVGSNTLSVSVPMQNAGLIEVQAGSLTLSGAITQTAGALRLSGGSLTSAAALNLQGGALEGRGTVNANVTATGATILPGLDGAADDIILNGNLTLGTASVLDFDLGGTTQGVSYDYLDVNGTSPLSGVLQLSFFGGFESLVGGGDVFTLLTANAALTGSFLNIASGSRLTTLDSLGSFLVSYGAGSPFGADRVVLSAFEAPEPDAIALIAIGLAGLTLYGRRRSWAGRMQAGEWNQRSSSSRAFASTRSRVPEPSVNQA